MHVSAMVRVLDVREAPTEHRVRTDDPELLSALREGDPHTDVAG